MKKVSVIILVALPAIICCAWIFWPNDVNVGKAQVPDPEESKLREIDKEGQDAKIKKAFAEAKRIQDHIVDSVKSERRELRLTRAWAMPSDRPRPTERTGKTHNEISWEKNGTRISLDFQLGHNKEDTLASFRFGLETISLGEFFEAPGIGDEAVLVKNVEFNKKMTNVGLHFVKGRAKVSVYLSNHQRSREENEKELMEIVRLIEPLIIARPDFNDP